MTNIGEKIEGGLLLGLRGRKKEPYKPPRSLPSNEIPMDKTKSYVRITYFWHMLTIIEDPMDGTVYAPIECRNGKSVIEKEKYKKMVPEDCKLPYNHQLGKTAWILITDAEEL